MHEVLEPSTQQHTPCSACMHHACTMHAPRLQLRLKAVVGGLELLLRHRVLALALGQVTVLARVLQEAFDAIGLDFLHDDQGLLSSLRVDGLEERSRDLVCGDRAESWACFRLDREHAGRAVGLGSSAREVAVEGGRKEAGQTLVFFRVLCDISASLSSRQGSHFRMIY